MPLSVGDKLGPYEIVAPLGAGGLGEVYRARNTRLGRDVALKILSVEVANDPMRRQRFELEARAVAALNHPNIVSIYDAGPASSSANWWMGSRCAPASWDCARPSRRRCKIATGLAAHDVGIVH